MKHWKKKPWVDSEVRNWDYIADHLAPDATSADAGKVLTVGETGKPEWGEGGGSGGSGGGVVMVFEYDEINERTISNFPIDDFIDAVDNHVPIYITLDNLNFYLLPVAGYDYVEEESTLYASGTYNFMYSVSDTQIGIEIVNINYSADDHLFIYEIEYHYVDTTS